MVHMDEANFFRLAAANPYIGHTAVLEASMTG